MPTIDRRLRDLEDRLRPGEDQRRPVDVAFVLELHKQPREDVHIVMEASDRFEDDRRGRPRMQAPCFPLSYLTDAELMERATVIFDRIEGALLKVYSPEEIGDRLSEL